MRSLYRRFFDRLRRRILLKDPRGNIICLPPEIILEIAEHLSNVSLISLSLTCRPYHILLSTFTRNVKLEATELEDFLQILEKDCASSYFCYICVRLHQRDRRGMVDPGNCYKWDCRKNCFLHFNFHMWFDPGLMIKYAEARLIMNRHFNGPTHGLSLDTLNYHGNIHRYNDDGTELWTSIARIIQDELFLQRTMVIWIPKYLGVQEIQHGLYFPVCLHVRSNINYGCRSSARIGLYGLPEVAELSEAFKSCDNSLGSCPICFTDYSITIRWKSHQRQGWRIEVVSYQQFGHCRSPYDWKWRVAVERSTWNEPRCRTQNPGLVRQRWMCPDGRIQPEGKFVGKALREPGGILGSRRCPWGASCERRPECEEHYNANRPSQDDIFRHPVAWSDPTEV
ncbi:hypothetical protein FPRO06_11472 [Fusarium proliferatum]|nr:hypothetical protein FPRO06_11472 [Fusarium proliferatum]